MTAGATEAIALRRCVCAEVAGNGFHSIESPIVAFLCPVRPLVAFNVLFYLNLIVHIIVAMPTFVLPRDASSGVLRRWARTSLWLLRVICGVTVEWRGLEKIPRGRAASSPPSISRSGRLSRCSQLFERSGLHPQARADVDSAFRLARSGKSRMIPVDRSARVRRWRDMAARGAQGARGLGGRS